LPWEWGKATFVVHFDVVIKLCMREIQKPRLLSAGEDRELAAKVNPGDQAARDRMIVCNLRLVLNIAKHYINCDLPFLDLIGEGNIRLIKAVERFKLSRSAAYITWWIRQTIERSLLNQSRTVRLPVQVSLGINRMLRVTSELVQKMNHEQILREVAGTLDAELAYAET
jgi:RNA polymerase primary sigma factor